MIFDDRVDAGRRLAIRLESFAHQADVLVLGVPRGGVVVAFEVAAALGAPLDVFLSRKLGVPGQTELAFGALSASGGRYLDEYILRTTAISTEQVESVDYGRGAQGERSARQRVTRRPAAAECFWQDRNPRRRRRGYRSQCVRCDPGAAADAASDAGSRRAGGASLSMGVAAHGCRRDRLRGFAGALCRSRRVLPELYAGRRCRGSQAAAARRRHDQQRPVGSLA